MGRPASFRQKEATQIPPGMSVCKNKWVIIYPIEHMTYTYVSDDFTVVESHSFYYFHDYFKNQCPKKKKKLLEIKNALGFNQFLGNIISLLFIKEKKNKFVR